MSEKKVMNIVTIGVGILCFALLVISQSSVVNGQWVEETPLGDFKIYSLNTNLGSIAVEQRVNITIINNGNVTAGGTVLIEAITPNLAWSFSPESFGLGSIEPKQTETYSFSVSNLGQPTPATNSEFNVSIYNALGFLTDSRIVTCNLSPFSNQGSILRIETVDSLTGKSINGIHVSIVYDQTNSEDGWTIDGATAFDFYGRTPYVVVSTDENEQYKSATAAYQVSGGTNSLVLHLEPKQSANASSSNESATSNQWIWIMALSIAGIVIVALSLYVYKLRRDSSKIPPPLPRP